MHFVAIEDMDRTMSRIGRSTRTATAGSAERAAARLFGDHVSLLALAGDSDTWIIRAPHPVTGHMERLGRVIRIGYSTFGRL